MAGSDIEDAATRRLQELVLLDEYLEMLAEAILIGNQELIVSIKRRIAILEKGLSK